MFSSPFDISSIHTIVILSNNGGKEQICQKIYIKTSLQCLKKHSAHLVKTLCSFKPASFLKPNNSWRSISWEKWGHDVTGCVLVPGLVTLSFARPESENSWGMHKACARVIPTAQFRLRDLHKPRRLSALAVSLAHTEKMSVSSSAMDWTMSASPVHMLKPNVQCDRIWSWGLWKGTGVGWGHDRVEWGGSSW